MAKWAIFERLIACLAYICRYLLAPPVSPFRCTIFVRSIKVSTDSIRWLSKATVCVSLPANMIVTVFWEQSI